MVEIGYSIWQVEQAAGNLYVRKLYPDLLGKNASEPEDDDETETPHMRVIHRFAGHSEDMFKPITSILPFSVAEMQAQTEADTRTLLEHRGINHAKVSAAGLQGLLRRKNLA